ncbi:MAG: hypothetical protein R3Y10_00310 [Ferrimonas sp.]
MFYLVACNAMLAIGPLIYHYLQRQQWLAAIHTFTAVTLSGLVLFDIAPHLWQSAGWPIVPFLLLGLIGPTLIESLFRKVSHTTHTIALLCGLFGLLLHTITDGSIIAMAQHTHNNHALALGIVLHRFPASLAVWWLLRPKYGRLAAATVFAFMILLTVLGYYAESQLPHFFQSTPALWLQAFVTGSILHVLLHRPHEASCGHSHASTPINERILTRRHWLGGIGGVLFVGVMLNMFGHAHEHDSRSHSHEHHSTEKTTEHTDS